MNDRNGIDIDKLVERIREVEHDHGKEFTAQEREVLRKMIGAYKVWSSLGLVGRALIWVMITAGALAYAWQQIRGVTG